MEQYLLYSIVVLLFMAFAALSLSIFLRRKFYCLSRFDSRRPEIYDKVYVVFEPYSQITVFHRFLLLIVVIVWYCCFLLVYFFFSALKAGLFLPFVLGVICLNMLPLEMVFEVVSNSNSCTTFISMLPTRARGFESLNYKVFFR